MGFTPGCYRELKLSQHEKAPVPGGFPLVLRSDQSAQGSPKLIPPALGVSPLHPPGAFSQEEQNKPFPEFQDAAMDDRERKAQAYFSHSNTSKPPQILLD